MKISKTDFTPLKRLTLISTMAASFVFFTACERQDTTGQVQEEEIETYGAPARTGEDEDDAGTDVNVRQPPPEVTIEQPPPRVTVEQPEPTVDVQQAEPDINVQQEQPDVNVQQQGEPEVRVLRDGQQQQTEQQRQLEEQQQREQQQQQ